VTRWEKHLLGSGFTSYFSEHSQRKSKREAGEQRRERRGRGGIELNQVKSLHKLEKLR